MVNRNLLREFPDADIDQQLAEAFGSERTDDLTALYNQAGQRFEVNQIVNGRVSKVGGGDVVVDIGYKSEGVVPEREWEEEPLPRIGDQIEVLLEAIEDQRGLVTLSHRKAQRIRAWERIISDYKEGDIIKGVVTRKVKGGLLVDIGASVFLPSSQVDVRRPNNIGDFIGQEIECLIIKIDEARRNIVVSRRQLIEQQRDEMKRKLFEEIAIGQTRKGTVKNIAGFGAFVDLGGIDGLLHVSDMSWSRIGHPSEMVSIDQELEVVILSIDRERDRIAVGLKQKEPSPWENIEQKFPVGTKITGEVVNVMGYGAFIRLGEGIEGLVHISEMSWTKRIDHPSEVLSVGDQIEVVVLGIKKDKKEISLGMKQTKPNPWEEVAEKYPPGTMVKGVVQNLTNYGAFIEIEDGVDGLLHVSDMSWLKKINHPSEMLQKGQEIECQVLSVDRERKRIALGIKQLRQDPWEGHVLDAYQAGQVVTGKVTKITNFGVFVELEPELEGLLHISELAHHKVESAEDIVQVGQEVECKILRVDAEERKIALSRKGIGEELEEESRAEGGRPVAVGSAPTELKGGVGSGSGPLIDPRTVRGSKASRGRTREESGTGDS